MKYSSLATWGYLGSWRLLNTAWCSQSFALHICSLCSNFFQCLWIAAFYASYRTTLKTLKSDWPRKARLTWKYFSFANRIFLYHRCATFPSFPITIPVIIQGTNMCQMDITFLLIYCYLRSVVWIFKVRPFKFKNFFEMLKTDGNGAILLSSETQLFGIFFKRISFKDEFRFWHETKTKKVHRIKFLNHERSSTSYHTTFDS